MQTENLPTNRRRNRDGPADNLLEIEAMVCAKVHQLCRTRDGGNKMLSTDGGLNCKPGLADHVPLLSKSQNASTNANLNGARR